jgi:hypothetical protein
MIGTKLLQFQDRKIRWFEDETVALGAATSTTDSDGAAIMERLVSGCLTYPNEMEMVWQHLRKAIVSGETVEYDEIGNFLKMLFARAVRLLTNVRSLGLDIAKVTGHEIKGLDELIDALALLKSMQTRILSDWPWPDEPLPAFDLAKIEAARQAVARGEGENVDDLIARIEKGGTADAGG